ncbi:MAG: flagellar protein export ATPase FliI [Clostridiales bacterium]|jgi:flagellum-specific ATP synthase|nr:flagellar protein export ATPase FliI [Clostridiales bacterium]
MFDFDITKYEAVLQNSYIKRMGRVAQVVGLTIESLGPEVNIGSTCLIRAGKYAPPVLTEVVGFRGNHVLLMPLGNISGIGPGSIVEAMGRPLTLKVSDAVLGRVFNGLGQPMDDLPPIEGIDFPITNQPPNPLLRNRITKSMSVGVKAIDGLLTIGRGQRVGIFAGSGVGKSTLLGMIARNTQADISVIALVGERGREVREFIEKDLGVEGLKRSVLVVATSDMPALVRLKAAEVATAIAEYFREQGKDVMLLMDSLTRFAMAQREVGLATGEPPVTRGYTPSVFAAMPRLLERAGNSEVGSITGLYTVLVDGDDLTEPVTDTARGILDGHIVLSRKISNRNHYPAIDVLASVSRVMPDIVDAEHKGMANEIKKSMAVYADAEDLINIGAYVRGSSADIDDAIDKNAAINSFLTQTVEAKYSLPDAVNYIGEILAPKGEV